MCLCVLFVSASLSVCGCVCVCVCDSKIKARVWVWVCLVGVIGVNVLNGPTSIDAPEGSAARVRLVHAYAG